jgi:plasmid stability protein
VANFHLRDIPEPVYRKLRARARVAGRSVNKELLAIVERELARPTPEELDRRLAKLRREIGAPLDVIPPEDLIRADRDSDHGRN